LLLLFKRDISVIPAPAFAWGKLHQKSITCVIIISFILGNFRTDVRSLDN